MSKPLDLVIAEIEAERIYATNKWPSVEPVADTHYFAEWLSYGRQYLEEAFYELSHISGHGAARIKTIKAVSLLLYALECEDSQRIKHLTVIVPLPKEN